MPESYSVISAAESISELSATALLVLMIFAALFIARMFYYEKKEIKQERDEMQEKYENCLKAMKDK